MMYTLFWMRRPQDYEHLCPRTGEDGCLRSSRERIWPSFDFPFYTGPQWIGWCSHALVKARFFPQSTDSKAKLFQRYPHRHTQLSGHPSAPSNWHIKLAITSIIGFSSKHILLYLEKREQDITACNFHVENNSIASIIIL